MMSVDENNDGNKSLVDVQEQHHDQNLKLNDINSCDHKSHSIRMIQLETSRADCDNEDVGSLHGDFNNENIGVDDNMTTMGNDESQLEYGSTKLDSKCVIRMRVLLAITLIASATIMSLLVHRYITTNETKQFHDKFTNDANKVLEAVGSSLERTMGVLNAISLSFVSFAANANIEDDSNNNGTVNNWPFVTLPDFALHAAKLLPLTDGVYVSVQPVVYPTQKEQWEEYASQNDQWVNETLDIQEVWDAYYGSTTLSWMKSRHIYGAFGSIESNVSRYMLPQWQGFPIALENGIFPYNFDWNSEFDAQSARTCIESQHVIMSEPYMIPVPGDDLANAEMAEWSKFFSSFLPSEDEPFEPMLDMYYPIIDDLSRSAVDKSKNMTANTVGMLAIPIYWRSFIRNILTTGSDGIVVVVHNTCNLPFTYQINGNHVVYLGVGDKHNAIYDDLVVSSDVKDLKSFAQRDSGYSGAEIDVNYCPYTLHVYPSDTMKASFVTNDATTFAVLILLAFCFTSCVFLLYDRYVERRQRRVKSAAMHSAAIISSLFPASVRERLFPSTGAVKETSQESQKMPSELNVNTSTTRAIIGSPIAQEYPDTTVIFADIVGFTAWSSSRDPIKVFHLLETLYAGFDALANTYGVFKIETIGDCYVAVVGLPKSRKNHAVVMVKFASAIRAKMVELIHELEETLGPGTSDLALRVGLNSGPTTAGVLRGDKARFQLFGDTVNTAARMESNGAPFKIHVSESTAELVKEAGKGHWLVARAELIAAKGKGMMQTYWCEPVDVTSSVYNVSTKNDLLSSS